MKILSRIALLLLTTLFFAAAVAATNNSAQIRPGLELIHALGCKGCHTINGSGGSLAVDLNEVGKHLTLTQIKARLTATTAPAGKKFMPYYKSLTDADLILISSYLLDL